MKSLPSSKPSRMKVLTVIENFTPYIVGGAELTVETYIDHIISGYDVHYRVLTGKHTNIGTLPEKESLDVSRQLIGVDKERYSFPFQLFSIAFNLVLLVYNLLTYKPEIIEFVPNNYSLYPLIFLASILRYPLIISVHNNSFGEKVPSIGGWLDLLRKHIIGYLNESTHTVVVTISMYMKLSLTKAGIDSRRMIVLYNPIVKMYPQTLRGNYAVFASRLVKEKGTEIILKAFASQTDVQLYIYGDGDQRSLVVEYANKYPHIKYFGKVSEQDVVDSIRGSSFIVAHPMFEEPFGRYILHSFSTLKPLISSYSGAVTEMIHDHENGILVQKGNIQELQNAINEIQTNNGLYMEIVSELKTKRHQYDIDTVAKMRLCILSRRI